VRTSNPTFVGMFKDRVYHKPQTPEELRSKIEAIIGTNDENMSVATKKKVFRFLLEERAHIENILN
jgi:hypothetical protein